MKQFVTIVNNKVISTREGETIVEGEIENTDNLECGMELIDGVWRIPVYKPTYEEERQKYVKLISDAQLLGETSEVTRLQAEWLTIKAKFIEQ